MSNRFIVQSLVYAKCTVVQRCRIIMFVISKFLWLTLERSSIEQINEAFILRFEIKFEYRCFLHGPIKK